MENDYAAETEVEGDGEGECWLATHGNGAQAGDQEEELEEIGGEISEAFGGLAVSGAGILGESTCFVQSRCQLNTFFVQRCSSGRSFCVCGDGGRRWR